MGRKNTLPQPARRSAVPSPAQRRGRSRWWTWARARSASWWRRRASEGPLHLLEEVSRGVLLGKDTFTHGRLGRGHDRGDAQGA